MGIVCKCEEDGVLLLFFIVVFLLMLGIILLILFEIDSFIIYLSYVFCYGNVVKKWIGDERFKMFFKV